MELAMILTALSGIAVLGPCLVAAATARRAAPGRGAGPGHGPGTGPGTGGSSSPPRSPADDYTLAA